MLLLVVYFIIVQVDNSDSQLDKNNCDSQNECDQDSGNCSTKRWNNVILIRLVEQVGMRFFSPRRGRSVVQRCRRLCADEGTLAIDIELTYQISDPLTSMVDDVGIRFR